MALQFQHHQQFLQQVQIIVQNGFLDPKILNEPISADTFDLVQMLIFYVMVGRRTEIASAFLFNCLLELVYCL